MLSGLNSLSPEEASRRTWAEERIARLGTQLKDVSVDGRSTIRPSTGLPNRETLPLPPLLSHEEGEAPQIRLGETIGEGGVGVVYTATQTSLRRVVAVKASRGSERRIDDQMLREARITGALEHPNVVPIHLLGRDEAGRPLIVMKRIDGRRWTEILRETERPEDRVSEGYLQRHLGILQQVALALHFAHTRSVLHRDVKPDNVMVGSFGEVYLVDWGIAVGLEDAGLPFAANIDRIEGTPVYLAPEMAAADGASIGVRSDVYLLGATLHELLTGSPPHIDTTLQGILYKAMVAAPTSYPPWVPSGLAQIAKRALARDPEARFGDAASFADALREYLVHRSSMQLTEEAQVRAAELDARASTDEAAEVRRLFHESRFGFDQALLGWPDNRAAREGRHALLASMIEIELAQGSAGAALTLLHTLEDEPPELGARVREAVASEQAEQERLRALAHDADFEVGAHARQILTYLTAFMWGASCITCGVLTRTETLVIDHVAFGIVNAGFLVGAVVVNFVVRHEAMANAISRRVTYQAILTFATGALLWPLLGTVGLSMPEATMVAAFVAGFQWTSAVLSLGFPWIPQALGQWVVMAMVWWWPAYHFEIYGVIGGLQTALAAHLIVKQRSSGTRR